MHRFLTLSIAAALALTGSQFTFAATPAVAAVAGSHAAHHARQRLAGWRGARHRGLHRLDRELDLTRAQRKQVRKLARASLRQLRPQRNALRQKRAAFAETAPGTAQYQTAANSFAHAAADLRLAKVLNRASLRRKIYGLLTPAQRTQLATLSAQRRERVEWRQSHRPARKS